MSPKVRDFLIAAGVPHKVHSHAAVSTFEDAKSTLPFDPLAMVKALAFAVPDTGFVVVALRAADRADYKKIADALGVRRADLRAAPGDVIYAAYDMVPGGVTPLPISGIRVIVDRKIELLDTVYCGTGRNETTLEMAASDLIRLAGDKPTDLTKTDADG